MKNLTPSVIDNLFKDKRVILVGNSVEIMNFAYGPYIDSFDVVVRFGKALAAVTTEPYIEKHGYNMFEDHELIDIYSKYNLTSDSTTQRLSIGTLTTIFLCEKVKNYKSLTLLGFDLFKKSTSKRRPRCVVDPTSWHLPIIPVHEVPHNHDLEKSIIRQYQKEGLLEWKMISNLQEAKIDNTVYGGF
jgi:hypothetical protein